MRITVKTLGCKLNMADSEDLITKIRSLGHDVVERDGDPQVAIVNSCTVTHSADRKSLQAVKSLKKLYPRAQIIVTGCGAQLQDNVFQDKRYISLVARTQDEIVDFLEQEADPEHVDIGNRLCEERTRANIPVQTGCESMCSYCIIPYTRGRSVNYPANEIIEAIKEKEDLGFQEIVLTGINIGAWGAESTLHDKDSRLFELMEKIIAKTSIPRIRLGSVNPNYVDERFAEIFSHERFCDQIHLSLQHINSHILKRMNRPYTKERIYEVVELLYKHVPDLGITTDVIVGFPGETQEHFDELARGVEELKLSKLHVFPFSARKGTGAWHMKDGLPGNIKKERSRALIAIGDAERDRYIDRFMGTTRKVLFEQRNKDGLLEGWTDNYLKVIMEGEDALINTIASVTLDTKTSDHIIVSPA